ncbi:hypothetical protein N7494_008589 [Penicillium frequentans]|uniref:Uncharacterized protein n=1 Tax=Penicillium frequentans TaxID=3151616 RepID=A0AAD6GBG1_9EURO|nr:hypothetical protein N7494_008589 [Penicillium glabrum]
MRPSTRLARQYSITHSLFRHDYEILSDGNHMFHVDNSHLTPGKPDLTFHEGPDTKSPIVGVCKYRHFSSDAIVGLGDPSRPSMSWEHLSRESIFSSRYSFRAKVNDRTCTFTWRRTHSMKGGTLELVQEATHDLIAKFSSGTTFSKKAGQLEIYKCYSDQFALLVLITGLALREKLRRRSNSAAGAAGAGGGA